MNELLDKLNPPQKEAVLHTDGPLLIFAGAGSGKTRVLTHRIAHLIQNHQVSPWNIFAVTFTNKAAGEMKERISKILGRRADDVWISTFHSAGLRILRQYPEKVGLGPYFTILDDDDQMTLVKEGLEFLQINPKLFPPKAIVGRISAAKNELIDADQYAAQADDFFSEKVAKVYLWYAEQLKKNNSVDFGDLLLLPVKLFEAHADILSLYQKRLRYLLVDEYQDTNQAQYRFLKLLAEAHQNICVVGDDDQSIYRWRGANIRNILDFELDFPASYVIKLEQNYRSTQTILKGAHAVVEKIEERRPKKLWTENEEGSPIIYFTGSTEKSEAAFVVSEIQRLVKSPPHTPPYQGGGEDGCESKILYNHCSVFYRTNAQSRVLEDELRRQKVPYVIVGGTRFYDRKEIKDLMAYLYSIANSSSSIHVKRIINVPGRGIGKTSIEKLEALSLNRNITFFEALAFPEEAGIAGKTAAEVRKFFHLIESLKQALSAQKLSDWVRIVMEQTGYLAELKNEKTIEAEGRIENLEEFVTVVMDYEHSTSEPSLSAFLDQITLASAVDQLEEGQGVLPLMTLHLAKGLEFDYVFLTGLEEGIFPHSRSFESPEEMDEERRLMYVGMTRARKQLYLSNANQRSIYG
ncbi:MAG: UvrD-helicase domain-containing protein, partial [Deltaproteobacteria bacterium]|nr:UvrD-helicase domain-containing protein [Deltaproteobacteria bacterium]